MSATLFFTFVSTFGNKFLHHYLMEDLGVILKNAIVNLFHWLENSDLLVIMPYIGSGKWLGAARQQVIFWAKGGPGLCRHMEWLGHIKLI